MNIHSAFLLNKDNIIINPNSHIRNEKMGAPIPPVNLVREQNFREFTYIVLRHAYLYVILVEN